VWAKTTNDKNEACKEHLQSSVITASMKVEITVDIMKSTAADKTDISKKIIKIYNYLYYTATLIK